jgi:hypothetical protein
MSAIAARRPTRPAIVIALAASLTLAGCSNMSTTEQRALTGTVGGAGVGAIIGAIGGNAGLGAIVGAGAGLAGGLIYDHVKKEERTQYDRGYEAGRHKHRPTPPSG